MIVTHLPDYSDANPYQRLLRDALEERGVEVHMADPDGRLRSALETDQGRRPAVIHLHWCHEFMLGSSRLGTLWKGLRLIRDLIELKLRGVPLVWTVHNLKHHGETYRRLEALFRAILALFADRIIVHCQRARERLLEGYSGERFLRPKVQIIPHGSFVDAYENEISRETAREELDIPPEKTVLLSFGKIRRYKRVPFILRAFRAMDRSGTELVVAGKPYTGAIEAEIRDLCEDDPDVRTWLEHVPDQRIQQFMNAADLTVFAFRDILMAGSMVLAMSFGKPVVAPEVGCLPELLRGQEELLYDPSERKDLQRAIARAIKVDLEDIGRSNYRRIRQFGWQGIADRTTEVYRDATER